MPSSNDNVLALDCSMKATGWAVRSKGHIASGVQGFAAKSKAPGYRFVMFRRWLQNRIDLYTPTWIVCEQPHFRGGRGTEALVGLCTLVEELAALNNAVYIQVHSATLKKFATGYGRAKKEDMIHAASDKYPHYNPLKDFGGDEADALALLGYGIVKLEEMYGVQNG